MAFSTQLPPEFSWLSPTYRPTHHEVEKYAQVITAAEGDPPDMVRNHWREAELQLWVWRNETRQKPRRGRAASSGV